MNDLDNIVTKKDLALRLRVKSTRTIDKMVAEGMPVFYIGDLPRFDFEQVMEWFKKRQEHE